MYLFFHNVFDQIEPCFRFYGRECGLLKFKIYAGVQGRNPPPQVSMHVVVVYHVTIVAIGHGLLKKFWPLVLGCVLRTAGSSII